MNKRWGHLAAWTAAVLLAACGGSEDGDQSPKVQYGKLVAFGDSLSDVGSYQVGIVASLGGGRYTVNGTGGENWNELLAAQAGVAAPCAAQTGLNATADLGGPVAVVNHAGCYGYAQGGARVTAAVGPGNAALWLGFGDSSGKLGQLTDPVINQIQRHLAAAGGSFAADDLVTVSAGGNDLFMNLATMQATIAGGGDATAAVTAAATAMGTAGAELAAYIKSLVVAKGATHVVVINVPDVSLTPSAAAYSAQTKAIVQTLVQTFNSQLAAGLAGQSQVLLVDTYTALQQQAAKPSQFGVSNFTDTACDLDKVATSLMCTAATTVSGDVSHYYFADGVHPTPYGYKLLTQLVTDAMLKAGWL